MSIMGEKTISKPKDCWCGVKLTPHQQQTLISLTMKEFEKPVKERVTPKELIKMVTGEKYYKAVLEFEKKLKYK